MSLLPSFVGVQTQFRATNFLSYNERDRTLRYNATMIVSPTTKFAVETSTSHENLVHLRCCYSNKYWVKESENSDWINAAADEPQEDTTLSTCTLFKIEWFQPRSMYVIMHVQSGSYVGHFNTNRLAIYPNPSGPMARHYVSLIDWGAIIVFPDKIALKGDNGKYLHLVKRNSSPQEAFQFSSEDVGEETVALEIINQRMGTIALKTTYPFTSDPRRSFWSDAENAAITLVASSGRGFVPVQTAGNQIGLRINTTQFFCRRSPQNDDLLYTDVRSMVAQARLQVEEPVISREVSGVNFRINDARIYDERPLILASAPTENTTNETHWRTVTFTYKQKTENTWRGFVSLNLGIKMKFRSGIPIIGTLGIEVSATFDGEYEWGETKTESKEVGDSYTFPVPPMTKVTAHLVATEGLCDVPFSYVVHDVLYNGSSRRYEVDGGVYTGFNYYRLYRTTDSTPLDHV